MPTRRAVWIVRLVFYPLAIGLIALAWHQRSADGETPAPRTPQRTLLAGTTGQDQPASARYRDGRPDRLTFRVDYDCVPDLGRAVWATYVEVAEAAGGRVRVRDHGGTTTWDNGWIGATTLDVDGRYDAQKLTGSISARMRLDANGVRADCRAQDVRLDVARSPGATGTTSQREPVTADVAGGHRLAAFSIGLQLTCGDRPRHVVWSPAVAPGDGTVVQRSVQPVGGQNEILLAPPTAAGEADGSMGTARATFSAIGGEAVRGTVAASLVLWRGGPSCQTPPGGVAFALGDATG